jgi:5'-phosphate synthase pdxT subunit
MTCRSTIGSPSVVGSHATTPHPATPSLTTSPTSPTFAGRPADQTRPVRIGVLALQGDVREHFAALREAGAEPVAVRSPDDLAALDGIIIPGGESTTIGKLLVTFELLGPLRAALDAGLPAYGSCAGMILLADRVLDGAADQVGLGGIDMTVRRNAFGRQVDSFEGTVSVEGLGEIEAVFIRAPWAEEVGANVTVLARAADNIVAVRQGVLLATAFHPELTGDRRIHQLFVTMARERVSSGSVRAAALSDLEETQTR